MSKTKERTVEVLKSELRQNVLDFLNHEYIREKIEEQEENPEFIMEIYDILNEINEIVKKSIKNKKVPTGKYLLKRKFFKIQ